MTTPAALKQRSPSEILKDIGAKPIITPSRMAKHRLIVGQDFNGDPSQRALVAVLIVGNGTEHLKQINTTHDLRCATDPMVGRGGTYYELDAAQCDALNAALNVGSETDAE
jgi:hypothetical protein